MNEMHQTFARNLIQKSKQMELSQLPGRSKFYENGTGIFLRSAVKEIRTIPCFALGAQITPPPLLVLI